MTEPERALERARAAAASMRAEGAYPDEQSAAQRRPPATITSDRLLEWALIEPDLRDVRSTRRLGAPVTALKRGLLRLLGQYHAELIAEQTRVNVSLVLYVRELEARVAELERELGREPGPPSPQ
jgi:hypothetical protein